jgi:hypothetical protein
MAPIKLELRCPICGALHATPKNGVRLKVVDIQCRYACHVLILGFAVYDGQREMIKILRHEVVRDLKFLRSASWDKTELWRAGVCSNKDQTRREPQDI